jgi:hypothetical protein
MTAEQPIGFDHIGIGTALKRRRLAVPLNQREYSWKENHVQDLLQDCNRAITNNKSSYFLGTIVLTSGTTNVPEVADGQQRLATTTILLAAIRDYYFEKKEDILVSAIENQFLFDIDRNTKEIVPKLTLNVSDNEFFRNFVLARPDKKRGEPTKKSNKNIAEASLRCTKHLKDVLRGHHDRDILPILERWTSFMESGARIIQVTVPDHLNAFVMFETLNDRGLKTSQADLIKNYLFGEADKRVSEAQQKWASMSGVLESLGQDDVPITMTYLRHLVISIYGHTIERDVFEKIRNIAAGPTKAVSLLEHIAENADYYDAMQTPSHTKWNKYPSSIRKHIETLRLVGITILKPLMLSVVRKFSEKEAVLAFKAFVCWSVRFLIVGGGRSGGIEESFATLAMKVNLGDITTAKELADKASATVPGDVEFFTEFSSATVSQHDLARYYLRSLELSAKQDPEPEQIPNDQQVINLEHILPRTPEDNWSHIEPELAKALFKRIGNMVLMQATANSNLGNSEFEEKKAVYKQSAYLLTKQVGNYNTWGAEEIKDRQEKLAAMAVKTWPVLPK